MKITFPANCTSEASRMAWCYRAQEKLRKLHNWMNKWREEGISQDIYNNFPQKIKNRYPYQFQITLAETDDFRENVYIPLRNAVIDENSKAREEAKNSSYWTIDFDGDIS